VVADFLEFLLQFVGQRTLRIGEKARCLFLVETDPDAWLALPRFLGLSMFVIGPTGGNEGADACASET
jgi:hypothetical protein